VVFSFILYMERILIMESLFETESLLIRKFIPDDAQGIFALDTDPDVMKFLGGVTLKELSQAQSLVDDIIWQYQEFGMGRLAIIEKSSDEFVGWTGIKRERKLRDFVYYDMGYRLRKKFWGQGIATETARLSLDYGFNKLGLQEINAAADMLHFASQKVLLKAGMQPDGTFYYLGEEHNWYRIDKKMWESLNFKT